MSGSGSKREVVKLQFGHEIRRVSTLSRHAPFEAVVAQVKEVFAIPRETDVALRYKDCEGDVITVGSSTELLLACSEADALGKLPKFVVELLQPLTATIIRGASMPSETSPADNNAQGVWSGLIREMVSQYQHTSQQKPSTGKWRTNGPRGCRGSGKSKHQGNKEG